MILIKTKIIINLLFMFLIETESFKHHTMFMVGFFGFRTKNWIGTGYRWRFKTDHPRTL